MNWNATHLSEGEVDRVGAFLLCVGGEMQARLKPRNEHETGELRKLGLFALQRKYRPDELASGSVMCAATGITPGDYLRGVRYLKGGGGHQPGRHALPDAHRALHRGAPPLRPLAGVLIAERTGRAATYPDAGLKSYGAWTAQTPITS